jgi:hypothetical protein
MASKYDQAALAPWLAVEPDPPKPDGSEEPSARWPGAAPAAESHRVEEGWEHPPNEPGRREAIERAEALLAEGRELERRQERAEARRKYLAALECIQGHRWTVVGRDAADALVRLDAHAAPR